MEDNNTPVTTKGNRWDEYGVRQYIAALREKQKEEPAPQILRTQTNQLICELYLDGYTRLEIRELLSVSTSTIYRTLKRNSILKKGDRGFPKELKDKASGLYKEGHEVVEIADLLHINPASVYNILHRYNIPLRTEIVKELNAKKFKKAIRMYQDGIPCPEIKASTGVGSAQLYEVIHKYGIPLRGNYKGKEKREAEERAIHLYCNTDTYTRKIEEETGVPHGTLIRLLKKRNIPLRASLKPDEKQLKKAVGMYREGFSNQDIKAATGVNNFYLYNAIHRMNIPLKDSVSTKSGERLAAEEKAVDLYCNTDMYLKEIGKETGMPMATLTRLLKKRNVLSQRKSLIAEEQKKEAIRLYHEGCSFGAIRKKTGISPGGLTWILQSNNIPLRGKKVIDRATQEEVIRLYREGYAIKEIKKKTGVKAVHELLRKCKVPTTRNRSGKF